MNGLDQQVLTLYRVYSDSIQFGKQQMWRMMYYCSVLFAVLFYLTDYFDKRGDLGHKVFNFPLPLNCVLATLSITVAVLGLNFLIKFNSHLTDDRVRLASIMYWYFDEWLKYIVYSSINEQQILKKMEDGCSSKKDSFFLVTFVIIIILALCIVLFRIFHPLPLGICPYLESLGVAV